MAITANLPLHFRTENPNFPLSLLNNLILQLYGFFDEFLFSGKLSTIRDIQEYLSYAIKILELANKYTWVSVLLYDDEFRIML